MTKSYYSETDSTGLLTQEALEKINTFTRKPLTEEEVYVFPITLCDNEIDRDGERFDVETLETLASLFLGKTGLFDHSMQSRDQTARIFDAQCVTDSARKTLTGEAYTYIRALAYMPRTEKNLPLIEEIDSGIKKEVSVGCAVREVRCSVCGANVRLSPCEHRKGEVYGDIPCHHILHEATDAYEWSFVAVPAQRAAGVTKSYDLQKAVQQDGSLSLNAAQADALQKQMRALEAEASLGRAYKAALLDSTLRMGLAAMPDTDGKCLHSALEKLSTDELTALRKGFTALANRRMPLSLQLADGDTSEDTNNAFII